MVYRGKPSQACERCRARRLKCDLKPTPCGQCVRAQTPCPGYRQLASTRFEHQTAAVLQRAKRLQNISSGKEEPRYLPLPISTQANAAFFTHFISSSCWEFLKLYYDPYATSDPFTIAMEAASLAFLWHQMYSETALVAARQRYSTALRLMRGLLAKEGEAVKDTTLLTTILFDVFEKITTTNVNGEEFSCSFQKTDETEVGKGKGTHVKGALALVNLRGLENFKEPSQVKILQRLESHYIMNSMTNEFSQREGDTVAAVRQHLDGLNGNLDSMARLANEVTKTMTRYGAVRRDSQCGRISGEEFVSLSLELDARLHSLENALPDEERPATVQVRGNNPRVFGQYYHVYSNRNLYSSWNMLRVARLDLNEAVLESRQADAVETARENITFLIDEILASLPACTDCQNAASCLLPRDSSSYAWPQILPDQNITPSIAQRNHVHTPRHQADVYLLIFPLYAVGRCREGNVKHWVQRELEFLAEHFGLKNARVVGELLRDGAEMDAWGVYELLGGYAFNA